jgi:hypothetical protein
MSALDEIGQFIITAGGTAIALRFAGFRFWKETQRPPRAVCGCEHHFAMHDLRTGECHDKVKIPIKWHGDGDAADWRFDPCPCRHYTGPEPLNSIFQPPPPLPRSTDKET